MRKSRISSGKQAKLVEHFVAGTMARAAGLWFFRHDFAITPVINQRAMHAGGFARGKTSAAQRPPNNGGKGLFSLSGFLCFHGLVFSSLKLSPELSYTVHISASGL
jgi:hypothetical protein